MSSSDSGALKEAIRFLHSSPNGVLSDDLSSGAITEMMSGHASPVLIGSFLSLLSPSRFTGPLIAACAKAMRSHSQPSLPLPSSIDGRPIVDIVGTGGDGANTFNASTAASLLLSSCGCAVIKHGNRSSSSRCGSADLLEGSGAVLNFSHTQIPALLEKCPYAFIYAPAFHPAMKYVAPARKTLGIRTIFNCLGPLTNPYKPEVQVTGVYEKQLGRLFAEAFKQLGITDIWVVHSNDGLDEISPQDVDTTVWEVRKGGDIVEKIVRPKDFGLESHSLTDVVGGDAKENAAILRAIFTPHGKPGYLGIRPDSGSGSSSASGNDGALLTEKQRRALQDYVILQAAACLYLAGKADTLIDAANVARASMEDGRALALLEDYISATQSLAKQTEEIKEEKKSILETISIHRRTLVQKAKEAVPYTQLCARLISSPPPPLIPILKRINHSPSKTMSLAAEIKRASPSLGIINADVDPASQALSYARGGAALISVLTEPKWFKGTVDDLIAVRKALDQEYGADEKGNDNGIRPCVLLKDFVEDEYQLIEARIAGADTALLIVAILSDDRLKELIHFARQLGMEPLVEVANESEMHRALSCGSVFIGINNRNLHNFVVNNQTTVKLSKIFHNYFNENPVVGDVHPTLAALSGIKERVDVEIYEQCGARMVLVGETLMKSSDPRIAIHRLLGLSTASTIDSHRSTAPFVKICGIRSTEDALFAADSGADLLGLIFVKASKRSVTVDQAKLIVDAIKSRSYHAESIPHSPLPPIDSKSTFSTPFIESLFHHSHAVAQTIVNTRKTGRPVMVGVFQNASIEEINSIVQQTGIDFIQLHGDEGFIPASSFTRPYIRVVSVVTGQTNAASLLSMIHQNASPDTASSLLLDTKAGTAVGGSGQTFDWMIADSVASHIPLALAGGLTADNVYHAIRSVREGKLLFVDVASGVEEEIIGSGGPKKDKNQVKLFIENAKKL